MNDRIRKELYEKIEIINKKYGMPARSSVPSGKKGSLEQLETGSNRLGEFHFLERTYPFAELPYNIDYKKLYSTDPLLCEILGIHCEVPRLAGFDIETSGLRFDERFYAFIAGFSYIEGNAVKVRQYFLKHPSNAGAMVSEVASFACSFGRILSYNGNGFDIPAIQHMMNVNGISGAFPGVPHTDLLPEARKLYAHMERRNLSVMEKDVLGFERQGDIPSWMIPEKYREYLYSGKTSDIEKILMHNEWDVISLFGVLLSFGRELEIFPDNCSAVLKNLIYILSSKGSLGDDIFGKIVSKGVMIEESEMERMLKHFRKNGLNELFFKFAEYAISKGSSGESLLKSYLNLSKARLHFCEETINILEARELDEDNTRRLERLRVLLTKKKKKNIIHSK